MRSLSISVLPFAVVLLPLLVADDDITPRDDPTCMLMLENFANFSSQYTYCTIVNSRPVSICQKCVDDYLKVSLIYDDISNIDSMIGKKCETELANLDRLQVFENGYKYIRDMWARAYCDTCFMLDNNGHTTNKLNQLILKILGASELHRKCIETYHNETIKPDLETCEACAKTYEELNAIYSNFKIDTGKIDFCMDVVDLINNTRIQWSEDIGCCKDRRRPETNFILAATGMSFLPVLFYLLVYVFTSKKEHLMIDRERRPRVTSSSTNGVTSSVEDTSSS